MVNYPYLSIEQQQNLPELIQAHALPMQYDDSTHQLWDCDTKQGALILKICNSYNVKRSTFWQGMTHLFDINLPDQLGDFEQIYKKIADKTPIKIPKYMSSGSEKQNEQAFIAVKKVAGIQVVSEDIDDAMVIILAKHIASLHQQTQPKWGQINQAKFDPEQWPQRLQKSLKLLAENRHDIPVDLLIDAIEMASINQVESFVPIMPDLRWDQFLQHHGQLSALVDLDAFVYGPKELELVLLEYLLNEQQAQLFTEHYLQVHSMPDLSQVRKPYRLLLFMMNVLGETNIDIWMDAKSQW